MQHTRDERTFNGRGFDEERSIGDLFSDLTRDAGILVRKEVQLAKVEMTEKATKIGQDVAMIAAGAAVAYAGFLAILAAIAYALALFIPLPLWAAFLLVGAVVSLAGFLLIQKGRTDLEQRNMTPRHTMQTMKENKEWAQEQLT